MANRQTPKKPRSKRQMHPASLANLNRGGRQRGQRDKAVMSAREVVMQAAKELGGVERFVEWIREAPENEFRFWASIYPRMIPVVMEGDLEAPVRHQHTVTFVKAPKKVTGKK